MYGHTHIYNLRFCNESFAASYSEKRNVQREVISVKFHRRNWSCNKMERPRECSFVPAFEIDLKLTESSAIASRPTSYSPEYSSPSHRVGFLGERKKKAEVALYQAHAKRRSTSIPRSENWVGNRICETPREISPFLPFAFLKHISPYQRHSWYEKIRKIR